MKISNQGNVTAVLYKIAHKILILGWEIIKMECNFDASRSKGV